MKRRKDSGLSACLAQIFNALNCFAIIFSYFLARHRQPVCCSGKEIVSPTTVRNLKKKTVAQLLFSLL